VTSKRCLYRIAALLGLFSLALVVASPVHLDDETQSGDHCAVCHVRHVSAVESFSTPAPLAPDTLADLVVSSSCREEFESCFPLHPSRGPPA
jgi:hypothetical protein